MTSSRIPTGAKAVSQSIQEMSRFAVRFTISTASRLGAMPVRNIELLTQVAASAVHIRYEPIRRAEGSFGLESYSGGRLRTTG